MEANLRARLGRVVSSLSFLSISRARLVPKRIREIVLSWRELITHKAQVKLAADRLVEEWLHITKTRGFIAFLDNVALSKQHQMQTGASSRLPGQSESQDD
jgi:hypothetical protein